MNAPLKSAVLSTEAIETQATAFQALDQTHSPRAITVAYGDGIGPEIMDAALRVLISAGAELAFETIEVGETLYKAGNSAGIGDAAWDSLRRTGVFLKAPITTPQGGGYKSLNVTVRKSLGLFANVRPCSSYGPFVPSRHPKMNVIVVRENEEDLYAGIEHRQTDDVYQCLKLISRPGSERLIRYAFDLARAQGRSKVTCFTKDNIMKMTDGLFHSLFREIASDYPGIEAEHMIIDIGAARLAAKPETFDVIVTPNLYGDIVSDIAAEVAGSVGMAPSANIGASCAMFEAIHGSAPDLARKDLANPSGLLLAGCMMLDHIGQGGVATVIRNAWAKTIEDGVHTIDIHSDERTRFPVGTKGFADAVIERLGETPENLPVEDVRETQEPIRIQTAKPPRRGVKRLVGVDVFVHFTGPVNVLASYLKVAESKGIKLEMISNRGLKVWPGELPEALTTDHWRCRFMPSGTRQMNKAMIVEILGSLAASGIDFIKTEHLFTFDGVPGFSLGQGQ